MNDETLTLEQKYEKVRRRNTVAFILDAFFFNFASNTFNSSTVLPAFVSSLTDNKLSISLLTVIYYGASYLTGVFSVVFGTRAKSPKKVYFWIAMTQRIGFLLMYVSTLTIGKWSSGASLVFFFISYAMFSGAYGMTGTLFAQLVPQCLKGNLGSFYGTYMSVSNIAGFLASLFLTYCYGRFPFPGSYGTAFLVATLTAFLSSASVAIGIREITDDYAPEVLNVRDLLPRSRAILSQDRPFLLAAVTFMILSTAEFTRGYYIVKAGTLEGVDDSMIGVFSTFALVVSIFAAKIIGNITDRKGVYTGLTIACTSGLLSSLIALFLPGRVMAFLMFFFSGVAGSSFFTFTNMIATEYAKGDNILLYSVILKYIAAPTTILLPILGGWAANRFGDSVIFVSGLLLYGAAALCCFLFSGKEKRA